MENAIIFSTAASAYLAELLSARLGIPMGSIIRRSFGDGEEYYRIDLKDRSDLVGKHVIYVASTGTDRDFLELVRVGTAFANYGSKRRIFVIPFFGYSTMERAVLPGEIVTCKVNTNILSSIPNTGDGNIFLMFDLHSSGILHYFEGPCLRMELYAESILLEAIKTLKFDDNDDNNNNSNSSSSSNNNNNNDTQQQQQRINFMFASADLGRPRWVETFAKKFNTGIAFIRKSRSFEAVKIVDVIGEVQGKHVIIYDDMTRSAGTLLNAVDAYLERGALSVSAVLSHLALNNEDIARKLHDSKLRKIISTNSHPMSQCDTVKNSDKFIITDASVVFEKSIRGFFQ